MSAELVWKAEWIVNWELWIRKENTTPNFERVEFTGALENAKIKSKELILATPNSTCVELTCQSWWVGIVR